MLLLLPRDFDSAQAEDALLFLQVWQWSSHCRWRCKAHARYHPALLSAREARGISCHGKIPGGRGWLPRTGVLVGRCWGWIVLSSWLVGLVLRLVLRMVLLLRCLEARRLLVGGGQIGVGGIWRWTVPLLWRLLRERVGGLGCRWRPLHWLSCCVWRLSGRRGRPLCRRSWQWSHRITMRCVVLGLLDSRGWVPILCCVGWNSLRLLHV
jgi:hypothetical protein